MIERIHLERFKRFVDIDLPLAPLCVLTGANGAGKTSILHALLLARQAASRRSSRAHVELNGVDALQLGEATDVLYRGATQETLVIEVKDGQVVRWVLGVPADAERSLNLAIHERPQAYMGVLSSPEPAFTYLCAERYGPRDVLGTSSADPHELGVGVHGELVAHILAVADRERIPTKRVLDRGPETRPPSLLYQTEAWMSAIVSPIQILASWLPGSSATSLRFKTPGVQSEPMRPANTGFGISYALPIVVAALRAPDGGLLIVENPEAHLHPAAQSRIGAFLAQMASDGVQVLVETHSDHVLNGMRRAVADGSAGLEPEKTAIHFFRSESDPGPAVESIELKKTGQLSAWPSGFFDQSQRDLADLARAQRSRK